MMAFVLLLFVAVTVADEESHLYMVGDTVDLWLNKIGPYHNPQETYTYYSLPFCQPENSQNAKKHSGGIGEILEWNELIQSVMAMTFAIDVPDTVICQQVLDDDSVEKFESAVAQHYWYQMYLDDLPIWGMVGEVNLDEQSYIYTGKSFSIAYNRDQIIQVNMTADHPVAIKAGAALSFKYSVRWVKTDKLFADRFERYLDYSFFEHQIHWFSIFNSFMMVIFLCGLVSLILIRTLKNDYAKYRSADVEIDEMDKDFGDDSGWKQIHGDVFRVPSHFTFFAACYGNGLQMISLTFLVVILAIVGSLYVNRGALISTCLFGYCITSFIGGYSSGSLYSQYYYPKKPLHWIRCMLYTAFLLPVTSLITLLWLNGLSLYYSTMNIVPLGTLLKIIFIWLFASFPLTVAGTLLGKNRNSKSKFPCRVNSLPRQIPEHRWYAHPATIIILTGWLPFGSIFIEMYFIMTSFWNYKFYYVYGFMLLVFLLLIVVSVCVTIVGVYFLLNAEDYRWPWISFLASGTTAVYVYIYSAYYFFLKTSMTGFLQTAFYFSYMFLFCLALGLMCGTIGSLGSMVFVRRIYRNIKID